VHKGLVGSRFLDIAAITINVFSCNFYQQAMLGTLSCFVRLTLNALVSVEQDFIRRITNTGAFRLLVISPCVCRRVIYRIFYGKASYLCGYRLSKHGSQHKGWSPWPKRGLGI
jgi:hypothetical protein